MQNMQSQRVVEVRLRQLLRELDALARRRNAPPGPPPFGPETPPSDMPPFPPPPENDMPGMGGGRLLDILCIEDGVPQIQLAKQLRIRPQSLSELLSRLENRGYIERTASDADKRQSIVRITESGRQKATEMRAVHQRAAEQFFSILTEEEKYTLEALLQKVLSANETENSAV